MGILSDSLSQHYQTILADLERSCNAPCVIWMNDSSSLNNASNHSDADDAGSNWDTAKIDNHMLNIGFVAKA